MFTSLAEKFRNISRFGDSTDHFSLDTEGRKQFNEKRLVFVFSLRQVAVRGVVEHTPVLRKARTVTRAVPRTLCFVPFQGAA